MHHAQSVKWQPVETYVVLVKSQVIRYPAVLGGVMAQSMKRVLLGLSARNMVRRHGESIDSLTCSASAVFQAQRWKNGHSMRPELPGRTE